MPVPNRREFLTAAAALPLLGLPRQSWAQSQTPRLTIASRQIEVLGKAAKVFGVTGADGRSGVFGKAGQRLTGQVLNATDSGLIMHWHGQVLASEGQDRAFTGGSESAPGTLDQVDFELTPGTHWMHSHQLTEQQLLAAPMICREADAEDIQEVVLMLHDFSFKSPEEILSGLGGAMAHGGAATGEMATMDHSKMNMTGMVHANDVSYDAFLANDRTLDDPEVVQVEKGTRLRLRIINGATATAFWIDPGLLASEAIAVDGSACQSFAARAYPIAQGQRLDLILSIPHEGGAFPIYAQVEAARIRTGLVLATAGAKIANLAPMAETESPHIDTSFDAALRAVNPLPERAARMQHIMLGEEPGYRFTINGAVHGDAPPIAAKLGERLELMFMNPTMMMHPMHLHGHHFQVVDLGNGRFNGPRRDVVAVHPGAMVTVAVDLDKAGSWFLHCHHLYHMATGMMTEIAVS